MSDAWATAYFVVFAVLVVGTWLFMRKQTPKQRKYWHPRMTLISMLVIGPFFVLPFIQSQNWLFAGAILAFLVFIGYMNITKVRTCENCGKYSHPQNLVSPAEFCPKCGEALSPDRLFRRNEPTGPPSSTPR